jgi:lysozyme
VKLSANGLDYLCAREAWRSRPYRDGSVWPSGRPRWAIGWGHTIPEGDETDWSELTRDRGCALLAEDLSPRVASVNSLVKVRLTQHQFDALVSLVFNIGAWALETSTLLRKLNVLDYAGASAEFAAWNKWRRTPGGPLEVSPGLVLRRKLDRELFDTPDEVPLAALIERAVAAQFELSSLVDLTPHHEARE